jgi:hypothetical protein
VEYEKVVQAHREALNRDRLSNRDWTAHERTSFSLANEPAVSTPGQTNSW